MYVIQSPAGLYFHGWNEVNVSLWADLIGARRYSENMRAYAARQARDMGGFLVRA